MVAKLHSINAPGGTLEVIDSGDGTPVLLIPALARDEQDFERLARALVEHGQRCLALRPREGGAVEGKTPTMRDYAADAAVVLDTLCPGEKALVIGATFGNRVARTLAALRAHQVGALVLLAAGGSVPPDAEATGLARTVMEDIMAGNPPSRQAAQIYFSPKTDLTDEALYQRFVTGWCPAVLTAQRTAARTGNPQDLRPVEGLRTLILQGADDRLAPPENGRQLAQEIGSAADLVTIPDCGHLILLDRPQPAIDKIVKFAAETP